MKHQYGTTNYYLLALSLFFGIMAFFVVLLEDFVLAQIVIILAVASYLLECQLTYYEKIINVEDFPRMINND